MTQEEPRARIARVARELAAKGASAEEIEAYIVREKASVAPGDGMANLLREQGMMGGAPKESLRLDVRQPTESTRTMRPGEREAIAAMPHNTREYVLDDAAKGTAALALSAAQGVPGVEAFEAGMGALGSQFTDNPMGFREARDVLRAETDNIPKEIRLAAQIAAGGAASRLPGIASLSPAKAGASFGAADQALSPSDMSLTDRATRTIGAGTVGAFLGKAIDAGTTGTRAAMATAPGANDAGRRTAMREADRINYGTAATEGAALKNTTPISDALALPDVKPFADMVRSSRKFADAHETTVLRETYKLMNKQQGGLAKQLQRDGYDALKQLQHDNIGLAKDALLDAADASGNSAFRKAVQAHAKAAGEIDAVATGAKAARRVVGAPAVDRLGTQSKEAMAATIERMPPNKKAAAVEGVLGGLKERIRPNANPVSGFGAFAAVHRPARVAAFLRSVKDPGQITLDQLVRSGLLGATTIEELIGQ